MQVITLLNEKGGVGKTTSAVHIAAGLAIKGQRVLLIDTDPQASATTRIGMQDSPNLYNLLVREGQWADNMILEADPARWAGSQTIQGHGQLLVVPGSIETRQIAGAAGDDITLFKERIDELKPHFDTVVIDTSPTPSLLHTMIYMATDMIVYPVQCQYLALDGLGKSMRHIQITNKSRAVMGLDPAVLGGVLPTAYDGRTNEHRWGMEKLVKGFEGKVLPPLRDFTIWHGAERLKRTIFSYAAGSPAERDMWGVIDALKIG